MACWRRHCWSHHLHRLFYCRLHRLAQLQKLRLSIHPVLAGRGQLLFRESAKTPLKLVEAKTLGTGVVVLSYQPAKD